MIYTPEMNDGKTIFVFGSNLAGKHAGGAARVAAEHWGAQWGVGHGLTCAAYALPTMDENLRPLGLSGVGIYVRHFLEYARRNPDLKFLVTAVGCGIAGFKHEEIAPLFKDAPANCVLPEEWKSIQ